VAWRVLVALTPKSGSGSATVIPISLNAQAQGTLEVSGFGTRWSKAVLMPTIVDRTDGEFTYAYGAGLE
jgi:hypothetical protein